jgi:hypothetical protein
MVIPLSLINLLKLFGSKSLFSNVLYTSCTIYKRPSKTWSFIFSCTSFLISCDSFFLALLYELLHQRSYYLIWKTFQHLFFKSISFHQFQFLQEIFINLSYLSKYSIFLFFYKIIYYFISITLYWNSLNIQMPTLLFYSHISNYHFIIPIPLILLESQ